MKSLPLSLTDVALKVGKVVEITRRDGTVYRHTTAQSALSIGSFTYSPIAGLTISAIKHTLGGAAASVQIDVVHSDGGTFDTADLDAGRFDFASVVIGIYDRADADTIGTYFTGTIQPVSFSIQGMASFDARGLAADQVGIFTQKYQPMCRADLGDSLCRVPILPDDVERSTTYAVGDFARVRFAANNTPDDYLNRYLEVTAITTGITAGSAPSFSSTVGNTTVDGGVTWTTRNAWTRWARIASITDQHTITLTVNPDTDRGIDDWFNQGVFIMRSGNHSGWAFEVGDWLMSTLKIISYLPCGNVIAVNDWMEIWPGCDKTFSTGGCPKFSNQLNFQGEGHFLGVKAASASPGGSTGVEYL